MQTDPANSIETQKLLTEEEKQIPWYYTCQEPRPDTRPMVGEYEADVAVIGGGVAGLSTALSLAESGKRVVVLEAKEIGIGASGRNGGVIVPLLKVSPEKVRSEFNEFSEPFLEAVIGSADHVFRLIEKHNISCNPERGGFLQPVHAKTLIKTVEATSVEWERCGSKTEFLNARETEAKLGTSAYHGALFDAAGGSVNPLAYVRGLARVAQSLGADIYTESPVTNTERTAGSRWCLTTPEGRVEVDSVVQCTQAQVPGFSGAPGRLGPASLVPMLLGALATTPQPQHVRERVLPAGEVSTDTRNYILSIGYDPEGRIITSGFGILGRNIGLGQMKRFVARRLARVFPIIGDVEIEFVWFGHAAINPDWLPRMFKSAPDWYSFTNCNGRGMALSSIIGDALGKALATDSFGGLPIPVTEPTPVIGHKTLGRVLAHAVAPAGALQDWWRSK